MSFIISYWEKTLLQEFLEFKMITSKLQLVGTYNFSFYHQLAQQL
jgi:hypothetical protein